ncbi:TPM domain-containing protein [Streptomyces luteolus]|uniref:TPM domain-containing protein n=1 Tax=Streptomyces luteolus TaxID=3043615 RepID=A0ABT6T7D2_9ACTN|nr:TPM domain-containing protein [Streptomyces sp. B-S-A12]MDI3423511.1 TPM domain-containing protein [Streptomyces sp. B-S-A12]
MTPSRSLPGVALVATALAAFGLFLLPPQPRAYADDPVRLSGGGQITDKVGALGDRDDTVEQALDRLYTDGGVQLFVAYVQDFSGRSARNWADATAQRNGLGADDVLLAVATRDRQYATSVDQDSPLSDAQLREVSRTAIVPALRQNDWAGAAIGAADGYRAVLAGRPVPTPEITPGLADPGSGSKGITGDLVLPIVAVGGAGALAAYAYTRRKRRAATRTTPHGGERGPPVAPLDELDAEAKRLLVATDDAVRTSTEELGFARAQFGDEAVAPFEAALTYANSELTAAFRLRQRLDDATPENDTTRRRMLEEIVARCTTADRRLDAEAAAFDRLRDLEQHAPDALAHAEEEYRRVAARADTAAATLTALTGRYADSAAAPVAGHVDEARERLVFAEAQLAPAREAVSAGDNGRAAVHLRAAEGALDQAGTLVDAVDRLARETAEASGKLPGALTETDTDLADARGLLKGTAPGTSTADLQGRIARAESVAHDVREELAAGRYDPIDALRRVEEADAALDEALAGARERESADRRARALLDQAMLTARSAIGAAADYVTTHRGAVGSGARTRLTEAERHLAQAESLAADDASGALATAQRADALAREARQLAERDVGGFESPYGGGFGGPTGTVSGRGGGGMGGAVLGGIILGELLGGGRSRGGGGFGGGFGGGGPGSFGGGGTRGRRGGGGRF